MAFLQPLPENNRLSTVEPPITAAILDRSLTPKFTNITIYRTIASRTVDSNRKKFKSANTLANTQVNEPSRRERKKVRVVDVVSAEYDKGNKEDVGSENTALDMAGARYGWYFDNYC